VSAAAGQLVQRLALGVELLDHVRGGRVYRPIAASIEGEVPPVPGIERHDSCLFALIYSPKIRTPLTLRLDDPLRHYVPRRLSVPIATETDATAGDPPTNPLPASSRSWRPQLFPGAAYEVTGSATGLRGRVEVAGKPLRWARIEARIPGLPPETPPYRAHGDDRGEFLLVVADPRLLDELPAPGTFSIDVTVYGPDPVPDPSADPAALTDPLWDLPVETVADPGAPDPVSAGVTLPSTYVPLGPGYPVSVVLTLGRISSQTTPFVPV
jgi:hypothetical protein